jgi:outer membrane protein
MDVYQQALTNDPVFKQAQADWLAAQQNLPLAEAALLPSLSLQAGLAGNYQNYTTDASFTQNGTYASSQVGLNLNQPIFNWTLWAQLRSAKDSVKSATANYYYAQQDLIARTVQAYLNVLQANDILRYTRANKAAFAQEYDTAKQKFDVGLVPITDVYDAQAKYDQTKAQEIANINSLESSLESLRQITGHYYQYLDGLTEKGIPLTTPTPNDIEAWSQTSARQNYQLQAQHYTALSSKENIQVQAGGYYPSLAIQGSFSDQRQFQRKLTFTTPPTTEDLVQQLSTVGLGMNFNIFSGGSVVAATRQARYQYASASAKEESVYRQVVAATRKAFLGVNSYSAQVKADAFSIKSAQSALESARAGYQVGTRTLLDVLDDTTQLYQSQQSHALDQYAYMNNFVALKESAGTLSNADVAKLSAWLTHPIDLQAAEKISTTTDTKEPRQPNIPASPL